MRETDYAYAVAVIRSRENDLLTKSDYANLIRLPSYREAASFLETKGYRGDYHSLNAVLNAKALEVWELLKHTVPNIEAFHFLIVKNDFHNLKAFLKAKLSGRDEVQDVLQPCTIDVDVMKKAVSSKNFDLLPTFIKDCAENAYDILVRTHDSLLTDSFIDKCCLDSMMGMADENDYIKQLVRLNATYTNIKIAFRMARSKRDKEVIDQALCKVNLIDREGLIEASSQGLAELIDFLNETEFKELTQTLQYSTAQYEKEVDERILKLLETVKNSILGPEPIIAYYMAKEMELLNIRIIMFCKHNGIEAEEIRERVRDV